MRKIASRNTLKEKMFKYLGQGYKNKENRETHTELSKLPVY